MRKSKFQIVAPQYENIFCHRVVELHILVFLSRKHIHDSLQI